MPTSLYWWLRCNTCPKSAFVFVLLVWLILKYIFILLDYKHNVYNWHTWYIPVIRDEYGKISSNAALKLFKGPQRLETFNVIILSYEQSVICSTSVNLRRGCFGHVNPYPCKLKCVISKHINYKTYVTYKRVEFYSCKYCSINGNTRTIIASFLVAVISF